MSKPFSILSMWTATVMLLLSTIVMHHHHYERVCIALEMCQHTVSGDTGAEPEDGHSHQESDCGSCRVHQLHKFITSSSVAKSIRHHISDGNSLAVAILPDARLLCATADMIAANWQHTASTLCLRTLRALKRRGPPVF